MKFLYLFGLKVLAYIVVKLLAFLAARSTNRLYYDAVYFVAKLLDIEIKKPLWWEINPLQKVPEPKEPFASLPPINPSS